MPRTGCAVVQHRAEDRQVVGRVVDGGGPDAPQPEVGGDRDELSHPLAHHLVVGPVELVSLTRILVGVAHPPHHPGLFGTPVDARREIEDHRQPRRVQGRVVLGHDHLVAGATREDPGAGCLADRGQGRPAGEYDARAC